MLTAAKLALRIVTNAYDAEITRLINAACSDLGFADVIVTASESDIDPAIVEAIITYVRLNFGSPDDYDRLKRSYDEQKAQLQTHYANSEADE